MFEAGNCFWIKTNNLSDATQQAHLFIIVLKCNDDKLIIVNIDKIGGRSKYDKTTILRPGEGHEFVTQDSYVNYSRAYIITTVRLTELIEEKKAKRRCTFNEEVLKKVCEGILKSGKTKVEVREAYQEYLYSLIKK
jgi:hypothetical protein